MKNGLPRLSGWCCDTATRATEGRSVMIPGLPSFLQCFFRPLKSKLSEDQFRHLWSFVLALVVNLRAAKLLHRSNLSPAAGHRTRHGAFCTQGKWDASALAIRARAHSAHLLHVLPRRGDPLAHRVVEAQRTSRPALSQAHRHGSGDDPPSREKKHPHETLARQTCHAAYRRRRWTSVPHRPGPDSHQQTSLTCICAAWPICC